MRNPDGNPVLIMEIACYYDFSVAIVFGARHARRSDMFRQSLSWFVLLSAASAMAAQSFRLGVDFSQPIGNGSPFATNVAVATDAQGGIYGLASYSTTTSQSYLVKLTPAGAVVYQTTLPFFAPLMAVDTA